MADFSHWADRYAANRCSAAEAIARIRPGTRVFIGSSCGEPQHLLRALAEAADLLTEADGAVLRLAAPRIATRHTHGTGCTFSAAIAAHLAHGAPPVQAISAAKAYLTEALRTSYAIGAGHSPVNHFHSVRFMEPPVTARKEG